MPRPKLQTQSPTPPPQPVADLPQFNFEAAITHLKNGRKITKVEWNNPDYYGVLSGGFLMLHKPDGKFYQWILNDGDIFGTDWVVI